MSKILVDTIDTRSGTSTLTLGSSNAGTIALGSGDVQSNFLQPSFSAYNTQDQQVPNTTWTKINFVSEFYDTDSAYDTSTSRFTVPSGKAGKYYFMYNLRTEASFEDEERFLVKLYKNGSAYEYSISELRSSKSSMNMQQTLSIALDLSAGDYIEVYSYHDEGANIVYNASDCIFQGFRIGT
jgi:hypothetical protein